MIVAMAKVRILGPRAALPAVLATLQDLGLVHLAPPAPGPGLTARELTPRERRQRRALEAALADIARADAACPEIQSAVAEGLSEAAAADLPGWVRRARRVRREAEALAARATALGEEQALIARYRDFLAACDGLLVLPARWPDATAYSVILAAGQAAALPALTQALAAVLGEEFELRSQELAAGETAVLLLVPAAAAARADRALAAARVEEVPVPQAYGGRSLAEAVPRMLARLAAIPGEQAEVRARLRRLARAHGAELARARQALHDRLRELDALPLAQATAHAFALEGWLPADALPRLHERLARRCGDTVVATAVAREEWAGEPAPVVLRNPRLLRPFEAIVRLLPLPRYGTIDPTPFVAVFFPMFFGLILGDVGYGALLAALGLVLHARSRPGSTLRAASEIAGACAAFTIAFGFLYGELFGTLGRTWLGLWPLLFDREEAILPFLGLALALGLVHVLLGLGLGAASALLRRHPREAAGRGLTAIMVLLIAAALLAAGGVLPRAFFTPAAVAALAALPVLVVLEGLVAPVELLSTLGNVLSYARVMALGTASVMLAVVANRMVGAMGSAVVGVLFALLFHLVNFALGLFTPTIHALRLHYVEFFGKFYSPGGIEYRPFRHWAAERAGNA